MAMLPQSSSLPSPSAKFTDNSNQRTRLSSDTGVPDSAKLNDIANSNIGAGTAVDQQSFRSDASVASTKFTDSTKRHVWQLMGHQCWICQSSAPLDIAHVLGQADKFVFRRCVTNNIISFKELSDFRNAIPLCPTCYKSYDLPIPRVFFLPTHVKFFFDWEEEDRKRRILFKQKHNEYCARRCPTEEIYLRHLQENDPSLKQPTYDIYISQDIFPRWPPRTPYPEGLLRANVQWPGCPTAAILKSMNALSFTAALPKDKYKLLYELTYMWNHDPIELGVPPQMTSKRSNSARDDLPESDESESDASHRHKKQSHRPPRKELLRQSTSNNQQSNDGNNHQESVTPFHGLPSERTLQWLQNMDETYHGEPQAVLDSSSSGSYTSDVEDAREVALKPPVWGPKISTASIIEAFCKTLPRARAQSRPPEVHSNI